eukprot:c8756_g1_i1 orf=479-700(+)
MPSTKQSFPHFCASNASNPTDYHDTNSTTDESFEVAAARSSEVQYTVAAEEEGEGAAVHVNQKFQSCQQLIAN